MILDSGDFDLLGSEGDCDLFLISGSSGDLDLLPSAFCSERSGDLDFLSRDEPILRGNPKLILFSIFEASGALASALAISASLVAAADGLKGGDFVNLKEISSASACAISSNFKS